MFGEAIRQRRIQLSITLRNFCQSMEIDPCEWSRVERGIVAPPQSLDILVCIAEYLQLEPRYVISMAEKDEDIVCVPLSDDELILHLPPSELFTQGAKMTSEQLTNFMEFIRAQGKGVRRNEIG